MSIEYIKNNIIRLPDRRYPGGFMREINYGVLIRQHFFSNDYDLAKPDTLSIIEQHVRKQILQQIYGEIINARADGPRVLNDLLDNLL